MTAEQHSPVSFTHEDDFYPQDERANQVYAIANCWQNVAFGSENWDKVYCTGKTLEWIIYLVLSILLGFLLSLHCIAYKKVNKRCSWQILKRKRVLILTLSLTLTLALFLKLTFMMQYMDLFLLVMAQLLRFLIWSLTLINFMQSAASLVINKPAIKQAIMCLKIVTWIGLGLYIGYGITLVLLREFRNLDILSCKSREFIIESSFLLGIIVIFHYYARKVQKAINDLVKESHDSSFLLSQSAGEIQQLNESRQKAMKNIYVLLYCLTFVAIESFVYSMMTFYLSGPDCQPTRVKEEVKSFFQFFDRFISFQSWFIPLIWLYWPTKARR